MIYPTVSLLEKKTAATSLGCLSKAWYVANGKCVLVKGNSDGSLVKNGQPGYEPFSEVLASRLCKLLGFDTVTYELSPVYQYPDVTTYNMDYVSVCERYTVPDGYEVLSFYDYMLILGCTGSGIFQAVKKTPLRKQSIFNLMLVDAVVGNMDRHLNNFDLLVSDTNVELTPFFDFGASCLSYVKDSSLKLYSGLGPDKSKPFRDTHTRQLQLFKDCTKPVVNKEAVYSTWCDLCQDVFSLMDDYRVACIKNYIKNRMEMFL